MAAGARVRFSRRPSNWQGEQLERLIAIFARVLEQCDDPEHATELTDLVQRGGQLRDLARDFAHGQIDIEQSDYRGRGEWIDAALVRELRLARRVAEAGYAGLDAIEQTYLIYDPSDRERVTFRIEDLSDDGGRERQPQRGRLDELEQLARLRDVSVLTDEEFEQEKREILARAD